MFAYLRINSYSSPLTSLMHKYHSLSDIVHCMTGRDTKTYTERICRDFSKNPRKFWAWVNTLKGRHTPIPSITAKLLMMQPRLTNLITIFIPFSLRKICPDSLTKSLEFAPSLLSTVEFLPQEVFVFHLNLIDVSKACGPDLITGFC